MEIVWKTLLKRSDMDCWTIDGNLQSCSFAHIFTVKLLPHAFSVQLVLSMLWFKTSPKASKETQWLHCFLSLSSQGQVATKTTSIVGKLNELRRMQVSSVLGLWNHGLFTVLHERSSISPIGLLSNAHIDNTISIQFFPSFVMSGSHSDNLLLSMKEFPSPNFGGMYVT